MANKFVALLLVVCLIISASADGDVVTHDCIKDCINNYCNKDYKSWCALGCALSCSKLGIMNEQEEVQEHQPEVGKGQASSRKVLQPQMVKEFAEPPNQGPKVRQLVA